MKLQYLQKEGSRESSLPYPDWTGLHVSSKVGRQKLFLDSQLDPAIELPQLDTPRSKSIDTGAADFQTGTSTKQSEYLLQISKMATEVLTLEERQRKPKDANLPPENERFLRACSDIASFLVQEHESQQDPSKPKRDVNLNSLRSKMSKKHRLSNIPPLTAIIAAIPEHYKKYILPKLIAKPISKFYFENCRSGV